MEFSQPLPANRAKVLCDRAIARLAPGYIASSMPGPYVINEEGHAVRYVPEPEALALTGEDAFIASAKAPEEEAYLEGLTEAEKAQVRVVGSDETRAEYAKTLKEWRESHR